MPVSLEAVKACFTYSSSLIEESFRIHGIDVEIWHDQFSENPYENCDGMAPALWYSPDRYHGSFTEYGKADIERFFWRVSPAWVSRNWRKVAAILDLTETECDTECKARQADYGGGLGGIRQEYFSECLSDMRAESWGAACDYLDTLAALYNLAGIPADTFQSNGYSQGDSLRGLIVHAPEWCEAMGIGKRDKVEIAADMQGDVNTFGAWAWGDCYGFTVGEDSCGGFYGHDVDHMADMIADSVNAELNRRATQIAQEIESARPDMAPAAA